MPLLSAVVTRYIWICHGEPKGTLAMFSGSATITFQKTDFRDSNLKPLPVRTRLAKVLIGKNRSGPSP
ncbi:MAG: hypothetical protein HZA13_09460 [Nitrospirae bacterium]|nr:hypothetical protein [Nitrospirota bacterium]